MLAATYVQVMRWATDWKGGLASETEIPAPNWLRRQFRALALSLEDNVVAASDHEAFGI